VASGKIYSRAIEEEISAKVLELVVKAMNLMKVATKVQKRRNKGRLN